MNIYDYETFKINSLAQAEKLIKENINRKINFLHSYESTVWQGPIYLKTIHNNIISEKVNYIIEIGNEISLFISLINLEFKFFAYNSKLNLKYKDKFLSIAKEKKVEILMIEKLKIQNQNMSKLNL